MLTRKELLNQLKEEIVWDIVIIGGGATGLGAALEATSRGYKTLLVEQLDYTIGTSSRSTKLVHGGVRYLAQGDVGLVFDALKERGLLLKNAPHLVKNISFLIPSYAWWYKPFYTFGLTIYDLLAGKLSFGWSKPFSRKDTMAKMPNLIKKNLRGSILYHDGQFDDSRLGINLVQTIIEKGGTALNYVRVTNLVKENSKIKGVEVIDVETDKKYTIKAKSVINATGVFADEILHKDNPKVKNKVQPSQGVHLVIDKEFLQSDFALMIPKTIDGRILFAVPWHNKVILGTTDIPIKKPVIEPQVTDKEIDFILETAGRYLIKKPTRNDVKSMFAGLRPLAAPENDEKGRTKEISRKHKIMVSKSGLITIIGGKWTTYREMGEDVINIAIKKANLFKSTSNTEELKIYGYKENVSTDNPLSFYGSAEDKIHQIIKENKQWENSISEKLQIIEAQIVYAVRSEYAREISDVLARRTRALFLDAKESVRMASSVAEIMAKELNYNKEWEKYQVSKYKDLASQYML